MNIRTCFLILSVCLLMSGCRGNVKVTDGDRLCVDKILDTDIQCTMEDMGYKADVILLETSDSVLLPNNPVIEYVSDSDIYISADRILYRFDNGGKFKNKIGRRGGGPMEYSVMYSCAVDDSTGLVHIYAGNGRVVVWSVDGRPVKEMSLKSDGYISGVFFDKGKYFAEERINVSGAEDTRIVWFDTAGNRIATIPVLHNAIEGDMTYRDASIFNRDALSYLYYNNALSQIQRVGIDSLSIVLDLDFGKFEVDPNRIGDMDYRSQTKESTAELLDFVFSDDALFLAMRKGSHLNVAVIDGDGICRFSGAMTDPRRGGGIAIGGDNDLKFWPYKSRGKYMYSLNENTGDDVRAWVLQHATNPGIGFDENSNQYVIRVSKVE